MNWRVALSITRKDLLDAVKNYYILFSLILPVGMSFFFWTFFPSTPASALKFGVYDPQPSRLSAALVADGELDVQTFDSPEALRQAVDSKLVGGLVIPAGFDQAMQAGEHPEVEALVNRRHGGGEIAAFQSTVETHMFALINEELPVKVTWTTVAAMDASGADGIFRFDHFLLVMLLVISLSMTGIFVVPTLMVEEKEKHTLEALMVSPAGPAEVAVGKALMGLVYSAVIIGALLTLNHGWEGNWPITLLTLGLGSIFMTALGLLVGSLFRTSQQVNTWSTVMMLALMVPTFGMTFDTLPGSVQAGLKLLPTHFMTNAITASLAGRASLANVWVDLLVLALFSAVTLAAVIWRIQQEKR